jgi:glycosyltransferase involved in cell wall biosynthesis
LPYGKRLRIANMTATQLAIVVPCYNEQEVLPETSARMTTLLTRLQHERTITAESRIYFVDDGSRDRTWSIIDGMVREGLPVVGIKLSRNRGHQNALLAGLFLAEGDAVVSIDADLQDDLEAIVTMLERYREGCDVVYGVREQRQTDSWFKRRSAESFYRFLSAMGAQTIFNHADYRLMSRRAIDALRDYREVNLYLRGIVPLIGYRSAVVEYARSTRFAGRSKYPIRKMIALALDAITSFSVVPLRFISLLGFLMFVGSMAVAAWAFWVAVVNPRAVPGWASVVLPMYFLGGVQLLALGTIGEYLGKLYVETKSRPRFVVEQIVGDAAPRDLQSPVVPGVAGRPSARATS